MPTSWNIYSLYSTGISCIEIVKQRLYNINILIIFETWKSGLIKDKGVASVAVTTNFTSTFHEKTYNVTDDKKIRHLFEGKRSVFRSIYTYVILQLLVEKL